MNIKSRNSIVAFLISLVTCGIYGIYWVYCMAKDALSVKGEDNILIILLCIFIPFIGFYLLEKKFAEGCAEKGIEHKDNAVLYLILGIIFPVANYFLLQGELNKLAAE